LKQFVAKGHIYVQVRKEISLISNLWLDSNHCESDFEMAMPAYYQQALLLQFFLRETFEVGILLWQRKW